MRGNIVSLDCRSIVEITKAILFRTPLVEIATEHDAATLVEKVAHHLNRCPYCSLQLSTEFPEWKCGISMPFFYLYFSDDPHPEVIKWVEEHIAEQKGCWCYTNKMRIKLSRIRIVRYKELDKLLEMMDQLGRQLELKKNHHPEDLDGDLTHTEDKLPII